jgi:BirA family biotin operon repressor/biotin-[acetyl-CoA-carboxylase] ligase
MPAHEPISTGSAAFAAAPARVYFAQGWTLHEYAELPSTNAVAAALPAWHAVRAERQTAGLGRFGRPWISDPGGLWLSASVPTAGLDRGWDSLPLAAGWAVVEAMRTMGILGLRLRWPNDVMIEQRKLAGLLVERVRPGLAVVGVGINVDNRPESADPALVGQAARIADILSPPPRLDEVGHEVLNRLHEAVLEMTAHGFIALSERVNSLWLIPRRVELDLDGASVRGTFQGIDGRGRLRLLDPSGQPAHFGFSQVKHLKELP